MKFARKKYRQIAIFCFTIMLSWALPVSATVLQQTSVTIFYHGVTPQEKSIALSGAEFILHKVGTYQENKWIYEGAFADCEVSLDDMSASGQFEASKQLGEYAKTHQIQGTSKKTDQNGFLTFSGLENGLYLIVPDGEVACGGGIFRSDPFLVQAPEIDELGNQVYEITVEPKNEWVSDNKEPEEGPEPTPEKKPENKPEGKPEDKPEKKPEQNIGRAPSKGGNAKTGDNTPVEQLIRILAVSMIIMALLVFRKKDKKRDRK